MLSFSNGKETEYQPTAWEYIDPVTSAGGKVGVIMTHNIILKDVTAVFNWYDNSNFDGRRPDSISVELTANEWNRADSRWQNSKIMGKYATLKASDYTDGSTCDQWTYTFKDVPVYCGGQRRDFQAIVTSNLNLGASEGDTPYTWDEGVHGNPLDNITPVTSVNIEHGRDLRDVEAVVEWSDYNNNDGIRPKNIIVKLYGDQQDGNGPQPIEWQEATIEGDMTGGTWRHTFKNVNRYADHGEGVPVVYSIRVEETTKNNLYGVYVSYATGEITEVVRYTPTYRTADLSESNNADDSVYPFVRLSHEKDQGVMNIYVNWNDASNRDGKRPGVVLVDFYKRVNGQSELFHTYQLYGSSTIGSWHQKVTDLPLYENGSPITYYVEVSDDFRRELAKSDYTATKQENIINLYYTPVRGPITTQVRWDDNDNNDGIRPSAVFAELYYNGQPTGRIVELNANNNWTATWEDLATYYIDQYGNVANLVYYGVEVIGDGIGEEGGYTVTYTPESVAVTQQTIIYAGLKHEANTSTVPVRVLWNDGNNSDGVRPNVIGLQLYANGKPVANGALTVESNGTNEWTGEFAAQPTHEGGKAIVYSVAPSDAVTKLGYTGLTAGTDLYLSRDADKGDLYVSFRFADANNADGYRPQGGYLQLYVAETPNGNKRRVTDANGLHTVYFEADGSVNDYFYSLPIYSAPGKPLYYTVDVEFDNDQFGGDFTKYESPKTSKPISLSKVSANQLVITMQRDADLGTETGNIYWFDCGNKRGNRPQRLSINVRNDSTSNTAKYNLIVSGNSGVVTDDRGNQVGTVKVYNWGQDNNAERWEYTISGLRQHNVYEDGAAYDIHYFVKALAVGYQPYYTATDDDSMDVLLTHVNYLDDVGSSTMDYTVTVNWMDNNNAWAYRPDTLGLDVKMVYGNTEYASAHLTKSNVIKENDNAWTYTFRALPTFISGQRVDWDAVVIDTPWYTQKSTKGTDHADYTLFQSIGFDFTANWVDSSNDDGIRPAAVRVNVYGDGKQVGSVTLNGTGNTWKNSISGLPVWRETGTDVPVVYTFDWSDGTKSSLEGNYEARPTSGGSMSEANTFYYLSAVEFGDKADAGLNEMTGRYAWETTIVHGREKDDVYGTVIWDDDDDRDGKRPESGVFLQLYADGNALGDPVEVTAEGDWTYTWRDEFVNETGENITYSVKVVEAPKGYTVTQISNTEVSLKHIPERVIVGERYDYISTAMWNDGDLYRRLTPAYIVVNVTQEQAQTIGDTNSTDTQISVILHGDWNMTTDNRESFALEAINVRKTIEQAAVDNQKREEAEALAKQQAAEEALRKQQESTK